MKTTIEVLLDILENKYNEKNNYYTIFDNANVNSRPIQKKEIQTTR